MASPKDELQRFKKQIEKALKPDDRLWDDDGDLDQIKLIDLVVKLDEKIIGLLYDDKNLRGKFFLKIKDAFVFKANEFQFFLEENKIDNSFTAYKNRIGLTDGKKFIRDTNDVVLDFPYKDCVLEGGQSTEEGSDACYECQDGEYKAVKSRRKEIFYNEILAHDEIDRLLDSKAFVNWNRYDKNGEQKIDKIKRGKNGIISENMLIKGNNLLALHSLKGQFSNRIKLIYIDPPYNREKDDFKYNDNFTHSAWLTFMRNRLEVAKSLLRADGSIFVQCDDNEQAYLKVLMDEVFGRKRFVTAIPRLASAQRSGQENYMNVSHDYILCYSFSDDFHNAIDRPIDQSKVKVDKNGQYIPGDTKAILAAQSQGYSKSGDYDFEYNGKNYQPIDKKGVRNRWLWKPERMQAAADLGILVETKNTLRMQLYLDKRFDEETNKLVEKYHKLIFHTADFMKDNEYTNAKGTNELSELLDGKVFNYPKPEKLIKTIIDLCTNERDIILDYHLGSGTTIAVAHKMNRQYIGIEQMDYIKYVTKVRMAKVISGEKGGISKSVSWQGGGEFIYFELAEWNEQAKEKIKDCKNFKQLEALFAELCDKYFLNYNVKIKEFADNIIKEKEFQNLPLEKQKEMFATMLDNNQLYVHYSEMADSRFKISEADQKLTKDFYKNG